MGAWVAMGIEMVVKPVGLGDTVGPVGWAVVGDSVVGGGVGGGVGCGVTGTQWTSSSDVMAGRNVGCSVTDSGMNPWSVKNNNGATVHNCKTS